MADTVVRKESSWVTTEGIGTDSAIDFAIAEIQDQFQSYSAFSIERTDVEGSEATPVAIKVIANITNPVLRQEAQQQTTQPEAEPAAQEQPAAVVETPTDEQIKQTVARDGTISNSVNLIFPLSTEITIEISQFLSYISKFSKLLEYYKNKLKTEEKQIKNYDLMYEIAALNSFFPQIEAAIRASNKTKPVLAEKPEKISISDYEYLTLRIINEETKDDQGNIITEALNTIDDRVFSDGSTRKVFVYNRIDSIYLQNRTLNYSLLTTSPVRIEPFQISPTTLSLIFNLDRILKEQINDVIPTSLLMCAGKNTQLSKLDGNFSLFGFSIQTLTSKVILQDFLNAYVFQTREITSSPRPPIPTGCNEEVRARIGVLNGNIRLYEFTKLFTSNGGLVEKNTPDAKKYEDDKKELAQLVKLCPDLNSKNIIFEDIKNLDSLGKLFSQFLERHNLACIVDEAIKCVMPQIPCEQILSDLTVDNFEQRLTTAFPHQKNIIKAISLNVQDSIKKEEDRRVAEGEPPLDLAAKNQQVLSSINKFIDLEALCKIDIPAIIELIKGLFNIKFDLFNMFDWQFNFKIEFTQAILEALLKAIFDLIDQILNELIGCDALDGLIAGIINSNVEASSGLYGDIGELFSGGNLDFANTNQILSQNVQNFLSQSADEMARIIKIQTSLNNPLFGQISADANLGITPDGRLATSATTKTDTLGGLVKTTTTNTGSLGLDGFRQTSSDYTFTLDINSLATTDGQKSFLQEIGKFQVENRNGEVTSNRISNDSVVNLIKTPITGIDATAGSTLEQVLVSQEEQRPQNDIFSSSRTRNKNRHILDTLAVLSDRESTVSIFTTQKKLAEQIRDYVKVCFSLLSPSEVIDLMTANSSKEVKLTIFAISKIRYPILNMIMQTPENHALLFASFGKLTKLDTLGARLQLLSSDPSVKQRLFDPNICAPFTNVYDFRKNLMNQTLPKDLADDLIDKLVEDDKRRANNLINSLAKGIKPRAIGPEGLAANKTPDGKNIEEVDKAIDGALSNIFDQIKISFDNELETYPNATATSSQEPVRIYETERSPSSALFGFQPRASKSYKNKEFTDLKNLGIQPEDDGIRKYYLKQTTVKHPGGLFKNAFEQYKVNLINNEIPLLIQAGGSITAIDPIDGVADAFTGSVNNVPPKWNFEYSEDNRSMYKFVVKTNGDVKNSTPPTIRFKEMITISGALIQNDAIKQELAEISLSDTLSRKDAFKHIFKKGHSKIYVGNNSVETALLVKEESNKIFEKIVESAFRDINYTNTGLLNLTASSQMDDSKKTVLINLIDFSPKQTPEQKACGIDTHLLQTEAVKKRIMDEYNNSPPPTGIIASNSKINSRYSDESPGHLSEKIMTGLTDTFIRTSVIHNIFKGLFIFDKYRYSLVNFGIEEIVYSFIENRVRLDIQNLNLKPDFEKEYDKIYNIFKKKELIPEADSGENKLKSIVKYHIVSVLKMISKMLGVDSVKKSTSAKTSFSGSAPFATSVTITGSIPGIVETVNTDPVHTERRKNFFNSLPVVSPYSNFWNTVEANVLTSETRTETVCHITTDRWGNEEQYCTTNEVPVGQIRKAFWPDTYVSNNFSQIQEFIKARALVPVGIRQSVPKLPVVFVLERYVKLKFKKDLPNISSVYYPLYFEFSKNHQSQLNGIISFENFEIMLRRLAAAANNSASPPILYDKERPEMEQQFWLEEEPKFGLRLNLIKPSVTLAQTTEQIIDNLQDNAGFIQSYYFEGTVFNNKKDIANSLLGKMIKNNNILNKIGTVQTLKETTEQIINIDGSAQNIVNLENSYIFSIIPFVAEEINMSKEIYDLSSGPITNDFYRQNYIENRFMIPNIFLTNKILASPVYDLLINYCLPFELASTFALMNSIIGMANEPVIKLLNGTKEVIKNSYNIQKNAGKFKKKETSSSYEKQKTATQDGPPPAAYAKAALTIPIGILKGLATAVDPNIFLADKIVLAGKMGFVQPRYRRVDSGEKFRVKGTNNKETILEGGIAMDSVFEYENGELVIKQQPTEGGSPLLDYNPVALVENNKIVKNLKGKLVVKQGPPFSGPPVKKEGSDYALESSNIDEQNVTLFDQVPSLPIFPGEKINIPYSVASMALAPFPVFSPGLTTYNIAMPFGPLFLAMEPLLFETPQFKAASVKAPGSTADTSGNLSCNDVSDD